MLEDTLKKILESMDVLNEDTRKRISDAIKTVVAEAKVEQEKAIRAELAERYAKDKKAIHAALEQFLEQELNGAVGDLRTGLEEVDTLKKKLVDERAAVKEQARVYVAKRLGAVEKVIESVLARELSELHESEKVNRKAYLNAVTEKKAQLESDRETFRQKAAAVLEHVVNVQVQGTLDELREDIKAARQSDFGREIYESFMTTFRRQFFDSNKEFRAATKKLQEAQKRAKAVEAKAAKEIKEAREQARVAEASKKKLQESVVRARAINRMLKPLTGQTREKMKDLLEASRTDKLQTTYKKWLPELLNEAKAPAKQQKRRKLEESVVELKTGGQRTLKESRNTDAADDDEILEISRLAGIEK